MFLSRELKDVHKADNLTQNKLAGEIVKYFPRHQKLATRIVRQVLESIATYI
jgi:hypothetical protein